MFLYFGQGMAELDILSDEDQHINDDALDEDFKFQFHLAEEKAVATRKTYVLHMNGNRHNSRIAVALSDSVCMVYDTTHLTELEVLEGHAAGVTGIKFSPESDHLVFTSSLDGTIKLWDLRDDNKYVKEFKDDTEGKTTSKPLLDFDITRNGHFLCGGTELLEEDSFLLFWDIRFADLLGGYWESHTDDITQVRFHPDKQDIMASGSTDGLMNLFNISKGCEDEAILHTMNTESSVQKLGWLTKEDKDRLFCITNSEELQFWETDGAAPLKNFSRECMSTALKLNSCNNCYIAGIHQTKNSDEVMIIGGSNSGNCLRTALLKEDKLLQWAQLLENRQLVRCSWFDKNNEILITAGEGGFLSLWKPGKDEQTEGVTLKMKTMHKCVSHQSKPY